jgi:hypothetical protein
MNVKIVENFFECPNNIRDISLESEYFEDPFLGYTHHITDENLSREFTSMIHNHVTESREIEKFYFVFRYSLEKNKWTCPYDFHEWKVHPDFCEYAGLVYLTPNPPSNSGTSFYDDARNFLFSVENVFNRMIFYNARNMHGPTDLFGNTKENSRMTLTFFSSMPPDKI